MLYSADGYRNYALPVSYSQMVHQAIVRYAADDDCSMRKARVSLAQRVQAKRNIRRHPSNIIPPERKAEKIHAQLKCATLENRLTSAGL